MKALRMALVTGILAAAAGCSRQAPPEAPAPAPTAAATTPAPTSAFDGAPTFAYLDAIAKVRATVNSDNRNRIPALIRGQDIMMLGSEAEHLAQSRQNLSKLPSDKVDPDAVQFEKNFEAILVAYETLCTDSAELYREVKHSDEQKADMPALLPQIKAGFKDPLVDSIGAAAKLVEIVQKISASQTGYLPVTAMVEKVGDDREKLIGAKEAHRAFAVKVKADFAQRYPAVNWMTDEVLPP